MANKAKEAEKASKALDSVTDYHEEKLIDSGAVNAALTGLKTEESQKKKAEKERMKELAKIKVSKDDIILLMKELDMSIKEADRTLREHNNDVVKAIQSVLV